MDTRSLLLIKSPRKGNLQVVATRGQAPNNRYYGNAGSRSDTRNDNRTRMYVGRSMVSGLRVGYSGQIVNAGASESALGNDYGIEFAFEAASPSLYEQARFNGSTIGTVQAGGLLISDPVPLVLQPGSLFYARSSLTLASSSHEFPRAAQAWTAGSGDFTSSNADSSSQVAGTGAMSNPSGGTITLRGLRPYLLLGIPASPMPAVAIFGDSIADGVGEISYPSLAGQGYVARGLEAVSDFPIPYTYFSVASNRFQYDTAAGGPSKRLVMRYFTHAIIELGTNDISAGTSLSTIQGYLTEMCEELKRVAGPYGKPLHVAVCKILPRASSSDSWATLGNQTVHSNFGTGAVRDLYNQWLDTQVGSLFDSLIDPNPYVEDGANYGKWIVNGTANYATNDGVHPRTATHALAAQAVTGWANAIAV